MAGVTLEGFQTKRLPEIITGLKQQARPIFQDLVKPGDEIDTSDTTTLGRLIGLISLDLDELWQALAAVYNAFDPNTATGVALDNIVAYIGVERQQGSPTVVRASVWGLTSTVLPEGMAVRNEEGDRFLSATALTFSTADIIGAAVRPNPVEGSSSEFTFITDEGIYTLAHPVVTGDTVNDVLTAWKDQFDSFNVERVEGYIEDDKFYIVPTEYYAYITIPSTENSAVVEVKKRLTFNSEREGDIPAPLNTITTILTPTYGWLSVTNEISAERGSSYEDDETLRERFRVSKALRANNMAESLYAQLVELEAVQAVRIYENMSDVTDTLGLPPHSFMAVVRGGADTNIAEVVWNNKPLGIAPHGTTEVVIRDSQNIEREVKFTRAEEVPVYVNIEIQRTDNTIPTDAVEKIRDSIVSYINNQSAFGEKVIYTRLFCPANVAAGYQINLLEIGKDLANMGTANLEMDYDQYPFTRPELVSVTLVS